MAGALRGATVKEAEKSGTNLYRLKAGSTVAA
jgi:hypothetical protein